MAEAVAEKTETMDDTRKKLREIYSFTFEKEEKVKRTETQSLENPETKEMEEVSVTKEVTEEVPYRVIMKQPTRRQIEDAELEFSVEMSNCIKKGILTKAMLAKKYSDTGGLMAEDDAKELTKMYVRYGELSQESEKIQIKNNQSEKDNHTADVRAENRVIQWYILYLTFIQKEDDDKMIPLFEGNSFEQKLDRYYELEEDGDVIYDLIGGKVAALYSFWYYSSGAVSRADFEKLDSDIEEGKV